MISAGRVLLIPKGEYNASTTYTMLDIVSYQGSSYIAKGTTTGNLPTNTTYWQLSAYGGAANIAGNFATLETTAYASQGYSEGALLVDKDGKLCKVTDTILQNDEIVIGTNVEETTVEELINAVYSYINSLDAVDKKLVGQTAIVTQTDLNNLTTPGEYYKAGTTFYVTNAPTGINETLTATFRLTVEGAFGNTELADNKVTQTIVLPSGTTYKRGYDGSAWNDWIEFATAAALSAAVSTLSTEKQPTYSADATKWDTEPTSASAKPVTSGGIYTALANKQATYSADSTQWDTEPTSASAKPVTSGGIKTALDTKAPKSHATNATTYGGATATNYGHVKLSDSYTSSGGAASASVGASSKAVVDAYNALLTVSSSSVSDAGWTLSYTHNVVKKIGKVVWINLIVTRPNGADMIPNAYSVCTIPDGYKPSANCYAPAKLYKSGDPNSQKLCTIEILSDGKVKVGYGIDTTGYDSFALATTYITS